MALTPTVSRTMRLRAAMPQPRPQVLFVALTQQLRRSWALWQTALPW
jgi:hypothetical protein